MPAREVVELGDLVEAQPGVHGRHGELGGVDDAALQRLVDVGRRQQLRRHAELLHDLGAQAEEAHLHALELGHRLHLVAEPARGLGRDGKRVDRDQAVLGVDLVAQLVAAAEPLPAEELADRRPERHRGEEGERRILAGVVARRRPARFDGAFRHRVEAFQRRDQRTRLVELDLELAAAQPLDVLGEAHRRGADMRQLGAERALHLPAHLVLCLRGKSEHGHGHGDCGRYQRRISFT